jgi:F0F1-type ATP synthase membrane subunit b/b'
MLTVILILMGFVLFLGLVSFLLINKIAKTHNSRIDAKIAERLAREEALEKERQQLEAERAERIKKIQEERKAAIAMENLRKMEEAASRKKKEEERQEAIRRKAERIVKNEMEAKDRMDDLLSDENTEHNVILTHINKGRRRRQS